MRNAGFMQAACRVTRADAASERRSAGCVGFFLHTLLAHSRRRPRHMVAATLHTLHTLDSVVVSDTSGGLATLHSPPARRGRCAVLRAVTPKEDCP